MEMALLDDSQKYDVIVDVVGDESSLEFVGLTKYFIDGDSWDTVDMAVGLDEDLVEQCQERAAEIYGDSKQRSGDSGE